MVAQSSGKASEDGATEACKLTVDDTVDDSEIRRENQLRLESVYPIIYDWFHRCRVVGLGVSEPSTV